MHPILLHVLYFSDRHQSHHLLPVDRHSDRSAAVLYTSLADVLISSRVLYSSDRHKSHHLLPVDRHSDRGAAVLYT